MFNIVVNGEVVGNGNSLQSSSDIVRSNINIVNVDCNHIPFKNNKMDLSFKDCSNLVSITNINDNVTNMGGTFYNCGVLNSIDKLPDDLTSLKYIEETLSDLHCYSGGHIESSIKFSNHIYFTENTEDINENSIVYLQNLDTNEIISLNKDMAEIFDISNHGGMVSVFISYYDDAYNSIEISGPFERDSNNDISAVVSSEFKIFEKTPNLKIIPVIPNGVNDLTGIFENNNVITDVKGLPLSCTNLHKVFYNCRSLVNVPVIHNGVTDMYGTFLNCNSLIDAPVIPNSVTNMAWTFGRCTNLVHAPDMSNANSVTNMSMTFFVCSNLVNAPAIPNSVVDMSGTFEYCHNLVHAPDMSNANSVTNMYETFHDCPNLVNAPVIPNSVTNMSETFGACKNLVYAPDMSNANSVTDMYQTFAGCPNLVNAPVIPNSVINMSYAFYGCSNLTGNINISSENITNATNCFANTSKNKEVYIIKDVDGVDTKTYNAFISAGYSTTTRKDGVLLHLSSAVSAGSPDALDFPGDGDFDGVEP